MFVKVLTHIVILICLVESLTKYFFYHIPYRGTGSPVISGSVTIHWGKCQFIYLHCLFDAENIHKLRSFTLVADRKQ